MDEDGAQHVSLEIKRLLPARRLDKYLQHRFSDFSRTLIQRLIAEEAVSVDGMSWKKLGYIPPDEDADACHVPQALVTTIDGKKWLYLFYATQIGYKKNDGEYHYEFDRIRAMRRAIDASEQEAQGDAANRAP